ncbi:MAG: alanine racemase, partial [Duncaniella sp.]|nr:alanine racemase [Duncaniella sp.]
LFQQPAFRATRVVYAWVPGALKGEFTVPFIASRDLENLFNSLTAVLLLRPELTADDVEALVERLRPVHTRLEVVEGACDSLLIHDRFTGDIPSLIPALDFMSRRAVPSHGLTLVLGDLFSDDSTPAETYRKALSIARARGVGRVIVISHAIMSLSGDGEEENTLYPSVKAFLAAEKPENFRSQLVLVKGSPEEPLAEVCRMLECRRNETVLEINLDAVVDNFNFFRSLIRPTTGIVCMIKASGYGAGSHELARTLQSQGASYLAVAVHDEGADLRQAGITMPVIVLNPAVDDLSAIFDNRLEPEIYSVEFLRSLIAEAQRRGLKGYPVHIKIDSGMHRLGFRLETLPEVIEVLKAHDAVAPASIFSHLCAADDPADDDYTRQQFEYFDACCEMLLGAFPDRRILRHILNSTGIVRFPERQYDMVRLGIGLYGVRTMHDGSMDALRPVSALYTSIISLKHWEEGTTIGYNRRGRLTRPSVIATVPIGYADGLNRHLGYGNARFNVGGVMCPTVGSICMDACMIDVTDVPDVHTGQRVEVFGDTIPVETLSDTLETI